MTLFRVSYLLDKIAIACYDTSMNNEFVEHKVNSPKSFILAGNAVFTLRSVKTGTRYTYVVSKDDEKPLWFVGCLTGPDNTSDYTYLGGIRGGRFSLTAKSKMKIDSLPVKAFNWTWNHLEKLDGQG